MSSQKPLILISNDDSFHAPGIRYLADCLSDLAEIVVVAPQEPHSGQSSAISVNTALMVTQQDDWAGGVKVYTVNGTPVDCIKLARHHILTRHPSLVVAGINHGSNAGASVIYSGTMGAVIEGCLQGYPSVGFSLLNHSMKADFAPVLPWCRQITQKVLASGLPEGVCLNVNFPKNVEVKGVKVVRAARSHWSEEYKTYTDPHGHPFYWLTGSLVNEEPDCDQTDLYWLDRQYGSVVPTTPDMNAASAIPDIAKILE